MVCHYQAHYHHHHHHHHQYHMLFIINITITIIIIIIIISISITITITLTLPIPRGLAVLGILVSGLCVAPVAYAYFGPQGGHRNERKCIEMYRNVQTCTEM